MMKKLIILIIGILFLLTDCNWRRKNLNPEEVFWKWWKAARVRDYDKMFEYEYFYIDNVQRCYNKLYSPKKWKDAPRKEQEEFISLYQSALKKLLDEKNNDKYYVLLRLKDEYQICVRTYTINVMKKRGFLYITSNYPGIEKIKLIKVNNKWYLINPFGYHYYLDILSELKKRTKH